MQVLARTGVFSLMYEMGHFSDNTWDESSISASCASFVTAIYVSICEIGLAVGKKKFLTLMDDRGLGNLLFRDGVH